MNFLFVTLIIISLFLALYYTFTIYQQTKITLETEKPPERKKTQEEERIPEGARPQESKRLPDVVIMGVKKSGTMTLGRRERRCSVLLIYTSVTQTASSIITLT